jgi:hypothetical protein
MLWSSEIALHIHNGWLDTLAVELTADDITDEPREVLCTSGGNDDAAVGSHETKMIHLFTVTNSEICDSVVCLTARYRVKCVESRELLAAQLLFDRKLVELLLIYIQEVLYGVMMSTISLVDFPCIS